MNRGLKWALMVLGGAVALVILILLFVPMFVNMQSYKPQIEKRVSEVTGRPFTLGGDLRVSLFPWASVSFGNLHLGNPQGFDHKDFIAVKSFEMRVKLLPLLFKEIQVERLILHNPQIVLEKRKDGRTSWEGLWKQKPEALPEAPEKEQQPSQREPAEGLPIKSLAVDELTITNGLLLWIDDGKGQRKEISDLNLRLRDVSLEKPLGILLSARLDGRPVTLQGKLGPLGKDPGKGSIPLDLALKTFEQLNIGLSGRITDAITKPAFDLVIQIAPFSPRKLLEALGEPFPIITADPQALSNLALKAKLKGNAGDVSISEGILNLDTSTLEFSARAKDFSKPDLRLDLNLDQINLDRYLPTSGEKKPTEEETAKPSPKKEKNDYALLRKLVLDGKLRIGSLEVKGAKIQDLLLEITGKNGLFRLDPLFLKLYQGDMSVQGAFDVQQDVPRSNLELLVKGVQAGPLLKDLLKKDFLEGTMRANAAIHMAGDNAAKIKSTLNGEGELLFTDGAIVGIDLAGMIRNIGATFGLAEKPEKKPRTDFAELRAPFAIADGILNTPNTALLSPLLRVKASGTADLVKENLDFRVEPKFVATLKGQGDTAERAGFTVPVLVTGTFSAPKFRPDLKGMLEKALEGEIPQASELGKTLKDQLKREKGSESLDETVNELLKSLPFGK